MIAYGKIFYLNSCPFVKRIIFQLMLGFVIFWGTISKPRCGLYEIDFWGTYQLIHWCWPYDVAITLKAAIDTHNPALHTFRGFVFFYHSVVKWGFVILRLVYLAIQLFSYIVTWNSLINGRVCWLKLGCLGMATFMCNNNS